MEYADSEQTQMPPMFGPGSEGVSTPHVETHPKSGLWSEPSVPPPTPSPTQETTWETSPGFSNPSGDGGGTVRRTGRVVPIFLAALLGAVLGTSGTLVATHNLSGKGVIQQVAPPVSTVSSAGKAGSSVAAVASAVGPSIVEIQTQIQDAFGNTGTGTGSGVIYRSDGYIITNNHVIEGATNVQVTLANGDTLAGRVVGTAMPVDDIAVVKIDRTGLPVATLSSIRNTQVGDTAIALGSPFGFQSTVTAGIVSALHRNIDLGGESFTEAIQTDAAINPGNSGGALVNGQGALIGIPTAIVGGQGGNVGIGFAIPVDIAKRDADEIIQKGHASRPLLGVSSQTVQGQDGAFIESVSGPAANAGLRQGDLITAINGQPIHNGSDLVLAIIQFRIGDKVTVTYKRSGQSHDVTVTLAQRPVQQG
ncbi:MAG: S1C family serine protease [Actinomycetota bacterium]